MGKMPKLPEINWKLFIAMILIIVVVVGLVKFVPKLVSKNDKEVGHMILNKEQIPEKIHEI
ncbi:MAG TPA: hypothetical protein VFC96_07665, partial [Anaerovoracaceae bacterium]|nr:hypothetical protein [Anaerovoracaceae bacterium]